MSYRHVYRPSEVYLSITKFEFIFNPIYHRLMTFLLMEKWLKTGMYYLRTKPASSPKNLRLTRIIVKLVVLRNSFLFINYLKIKKIY